VVQLSTGEVAEVIRGGVALDRPRVRIVMDAAGGMLGAPVDVDLANPRAGDPPRKVVRVMNTDGWRKGLEKSEAELPSHSAMRVAQEISQRSGSVDAAAPAPRVGKGTGEGSSPSGRVDSAISSVSQASFPSLGSSPSAVAEAMGRMINDSLYPDALVADAKGGGNEALQGRGKLARPPASLEPTARGTLAATPLAHVLVYMLDHSLTGSVVFYEQDGYEHDIYFSNGIPSKARLGRTMALLGEELILMGAMERGVLDNAAATARRLGVLLGEFLVGENLVSRDVLARALEAQVLRKVASLANLPPETSYSFYRDFNTLSEWGGREITIGGPLNPILATVRAWHDRARVRATLGRIGKHPLVFHEEADLASLLLTPQERLAMDAIRAENCSLPQLYKKKLADDEVVSSLVYTLAVTRQFAFKGQKKSPMATRSALPATALYGVVPPLSQPTSSSGMQAVGPVSSQREFGTANGPMSAPSAQGPGASAAVASPLASTFTSNKPPSRPAPAVSRSAASAPQTSQRPQGGPLVRPALRPIGGGPTLAGGAPSPASGRPGPRSSPPREESPEILIGDEIVTDPNAPSSELAEAEAALEAMTNFRLAETALQRGDIPGAEKLASKAVNGDPSQSEYRVLLAWIRAMGSSPNAIDEAISVLGKVIEEDADNERALLYRGKLYKRGGKLREAQHDFNALLSVNPQHREAASELRLMKMKK
jgi:hypothetical protein